MVRAGSSLFLLAFSIAPLFHSNHHLTPLTTPKMFSKLSLVALLAAPFVSGLVLQAPSNPKSGGTITINWTNEKGDPSTWSFELVNVLFHDAFAIANNVDPSAGSLTLQLPQVPVSDGYTLEAVNIANINDVFATSGSFSIGAQNSASQSATPAPAPSSQTTKGSGQASPSASGTATVTASSVSLTLTTSTTVVSSGTGSVSSGVAVSSGTASSLSSIGTGTGTGTGTVTSPTGTATGTSTSTTSTSTTSSAASASRVILGGPLSGGLGVAVLSAIAGAAMIYL